MPQCCETESWRSVEDPNASRPLGDEHISHVWGGEKKTNDFYFYFYFYLFRRNRYSGYRTGDPKSKTKSKNLPGG